MVPALTSSRLVILSFLWDSRYVILCELWSNYAQLYYYCVYTPQVFPGNLLQPTYADSDNRHQLMARSEVERRGQYFEQLEDLLPGRLMIRQVVVLLIKNCLNNDPSQRPTAEQLVTSLEEIKSEVEGSYGELATIDAVRQVMTVKALKANKVHEIQQLHEQLEVKICFIILDMCY